MVRDGALCSEPARPGARVGAEAVHARLPGGALGIRQALGPAALIARPDEAGQAHADRRAGRRCLTARVELDARVRSAGFGYYWHAWLFDLTTKHSVNTVVQLCRDCQWLGEI